MAVVLVSGTVYNDIVKCVVRKQCFHKKGIVFIPYIYNAKTAAIISDNICTVLEDSNPQRAPR